MKYLKTIWSLFTRLVVVVFNIVALPFKLILFLLGIIPSLLSGNIKNYLKLKYFLCKQRFDCIGRIVDTAIHSRNTPYVAMVKTLAVDNYAFTVVDATIESERFIKYNEGENIEYKQESKECHESDN